MNPQSLALRVLGGLGLAMLLALAGLWAGYSLATTQAEAATARQLQKQAEQFAKAVKAGEADAAALREQLGLQGRYTATLMERSAHAAPLALVHPPLRAAAAQPQCAGQAVPALEATAAAGQPPATEPAQPASADVVLSLAAVSLWDSALAGHDVSVGACRADDPASAACAAESGLALEHAWANHRRNAASCAEDRARHQALINHLQARQP